MCRPFIVCSFASQAQGIQADADALERTFCHDHLSADAKKPMHRIKM